MKINGRNALTGPVLPIKQNVRTLKAPANVKTDRLNLSSEVLAMQQKQTDRVTAIKSEMANGTYHVDLDRLAAAIVAKEAF